MESQWRVTLVFLLVMFTEGCCYIHSPSVLLARAKGQSVLLSVSTLFPLEQVELQGTWSLTPTTSRGSKTTLVSFTKESTIIDMLYRRRLRFIQPLSLQIHNLSQADEGFYQLKVNLEFHNQTGRVLRVERTVQVTVDELVSTPVVERSPAHVVVEDQVNVTWRCWAPRGTRVSFLWLKDGVRVVPSTRHKLSPDNSSLVLSPVRRQDRGLYRCVVTNPVSSGRSSTAQLSVYYGPYDLAVHSAHSPRTGPVFTIGPGQLAHFECQADSNPPNTCVWISTSHNSSQVIAEGPSLQLPSHRLFQAEEYLCRAFNNVTHKQQEAHFTLVVASVGAGRDRLAQDSRPASSLTVLTVFSLLALSCALLLLLWKRCHPRAIKGLHNRPTERNSPYCSGHEDAAEDFGIYEFLAQPPRAPSAQEVHSTIYEVIQHVPDPHPRANPLPVGGVQTVKVEL
uniref:HEPACAM family member 2 n=1 Tax=Neogobius melanostomus TaxID=47308 RepID=A0A8C6UVN3_9GOBI